MDCRRFSNAFPAVFMGVMLLALCSCREERIVQPVPPSDTAQVLVNSSFELGGNPNLAGWVVSNSSATGFSPDVPSDGGVWSVTLEAISGLPSSSADILTIVPTVEGSHIYTLSLWAKHAGIIGGSAAIMLKQSGALLVLQSAFIEDTTWMEVTLRDTITTLPGDSIGVRLSGGISQLAAGTTYFDLCVLERFSE